MGNLAGKKCTPCKGNEKPLPVEEAKKLLKDLKGWKLEKNSLVKEFSFRNFMVALAFTNGIGQIAEEENHHPDIALSWGKVGVKLFTHKIDGLSLNDFILAAKIDNIYPKYDL